MFAIRFYRIYDVGREISLDLLERRLAATYPTSRPRFLRVKPKSIMMEDPPIQVRMDPFSIHKDGRSYDFSVTVRVFDVGAISLCFGLEIESELQEVALLFSEQEGLDPHFEEYVSRTKEIFRPHLPDIEIDSGFFEDYTIYVSDRMDEPIDPAPLLIGDRTPLSSKMHEEITRNTLSYAVDDRVIISWGSALVASPEPQTDILDLIEYAIVQIFELRYYDRELVRRVEKMYDDIDQADRLPRFLRMRRYHVIMTEIMETYAGLSEVIEEVNNLIKVTEDVYYAKVYATALRELRSREWSESVTRRINVLRDNYSMLSDEVRIQHSYFLEWIIIILIALEFAFAIWQFLRA
ncbi:RMD1 family protein [Methanofollis fontis]|uniref:DUF155 domain-containing protein n=1 Tax=Methanofollis fontis TaxID=2052832 RepID=A0A483CSB9_9EURY|nr:hypothetical protein [Methanofollis fontis]TAJ45768.1 hypothetical protein CUJ86_03405 [Methanofollis fontis]